MKIIVEIYFYKDDECKYYIIENISLAEYSGQELRCLEWISTLTWL